MTVWQALYCISLLQSQQRRQAMLKEFAKIKYPGQFIDAIALDSNNLKNINYDRGRAARCYCLPTCHKHGQRKLRAIEVVIALSHRLAYKKMLDEDLDIVLICEDDVVFQTDFIASLQQLCQNKELQEDLYSSKPTIVMVGGRADNPGLKITKHSVARSHLGSYSNYCYLINYAAAQVLVKSFFPITRPEDSYKRYLIAQGQLFAWQVQPSLVAELSSGVNLPAKYKRFSKMK